MFFDAEIPYDCVDCSGEKYFVAEPKNMISGKEWRIFHTCSSKEHAMAVYRAAKHKERQKELKIVVIKWKCQEVEI